MFVFILLYTISDDIIIITIFVTDEPQEGK